MRRAFLPALVVVSVLLAGCSKDKKNPASPGGGQPLVYSQETPQVTLASLLTAYESRDSSEYRKLFAVDYVGFSYDTSEAYGPQPGTFTREDEIAHIKALAEDPTVIRINADFGPQASWTTYDVMGPAGEAWKEIVIYNPALEIDSYSNTYLIPSNEVMRFRFAPDTSSTSPPDTVWSVVRWYEDHL
jgi:hypothetical protein